MRQSGQPVVLTVDGESALVVQDADSYRKLLAEVEAARIVEGIRRGLEDVDAGHGQPFEDAFAEIRRGLEDAAAGRTMSLDDLKARIRDRHGIEA